MIRFLAVVFAFFFFSCSSSPEREVFSMPDYTEEDARQEEIKRIEEILKDNPVKALWRAHLLGDESEKRKCFSEVEKKFNESVEKMDWFNALKYWDSLASSDFKGIDSLKTSRNEIQSKMLSSVPGLLKNEAESRKVAEFISGTVTIWVDKGLKIEKGMGYADRVIGSGFFISKDGYIVTNHHVISDVVDKKNKEFARLFVKLAEDSDTRIPAKVIGYDKIIDLALLKAEVDAPFVFNLGASADLDVGDSIYAIGSPIGLERTLTSGIVSATDRKLFTLGSVMQIDAAVNSGNSGGPCIDSNGNVQAIVFAGVPQYQGLNFAIPVEYLKAMLPALFSGGDVNHAWIGAFGRTWKNLGKNSGLEVQYVMPGGSAFRAGIREGDVITSVSGGKVETLEDFQNALLHSGEGTIVKIKYINGAESENPEEKECAVFLDLRPESPGKSVYDADLLANAFVPIFGMKLESISEKSRKKFSISKILKGSIGDESGFSENEPLEVRTLKFNAEKTAVYVDVYTKNRKNGYIDSWQRLTAPLDSPYYF